MSKFKVQYTERFLKREKRFLRKYPNIIPQYEKTIQLLETNPHHPSLRLHKLKGRHQEVHSVSINIKYHITIEFIIQDKLIIPINIGSHDEVYS